MRARIGDAPLWIVVHVVGFLAIIGPLGITSRVLHVTGSTTPGWIGPVISAAAVLVLVSLLVQYLRRRPLDRTVRAYYRALLAIVGLLALGGTWAVGTIVAALALLHSFFIDREVRPTPGAPPITKEYREWLERGEEHR